MQSVDIASDARTESGRAPADPPRSSAPLRSRLADVLRASAIAGLFGGALVFLVETLDRTATLWPSFNSAGEPFVFALYLAPAIWLGLAAGLVAGPLLAAPGVATAPLERVLSRRFGRFAEAAAVAVVAVVLAGAFGVAFRMALRAMRVRSLTRIGETLSLYFMDANAPTLSWFAHAIAAWLFPMIVIGVFFGAAAALYAARLVAPGPPRFPGLVRRALTGAAVLALVGLYTLDSRFEYARYDRIVHVPAATVECVLAFWIAAVVYRGLRTETARRAATRAALAILAFAMLASGFVAIHFGTNQNLKALVWRRSVVARRAYEAAVRLGDRDGDGFASILAYGDLDDRDPNVNPMASEIAGNGIDDNCIGGDLAVEPTAAAPGAVAAPVHGKRFVLIAIDTLRADRMSLYGYGRPTTPQIDEYARSGLVFDRCYSAGTNTAVAFSAMQTSAFRAAVFEPEQTRLFPTLEKAGYTTGQINAVREDIWLRAKHTSTPYRRVILDGIHDFPHEIGDEFWDADRVTDAAIEYLSALPSDAPSATWVHYFDPHTPRRKMAPFDYGDSASDKYDTEVAFADREVGRLLDWMTASGMMKDTIVVLVADHGEAFLEHGMDFHGNRPYAEQIHIPLVVWAPGLAAGRSPSPVSIVDIAPTVFDFLGLGPMPGAAGRSLFTEVSADRPIFSETPFNIVDGPFHAYAVTQNGWKLIYDAVGDTTELYDLERDPRELHNLADSEPERTATMRATLAHWLDTTRSIASAAEARSILEDD